MRKEFLPGIVKELIDNPVEEKDIDEIIDLLYDSIEDDNTIEYVKENHERFSDRLWYNILY